MAIRVNGVLIPEQAVLAELKRLIDYYSQHFSRAELGRQMEVLVSGPRNMQSEHGCCSTRSSAGTWMCPMPRWTRRCRP